MSLLLLIRHGDNDYLKMNKMPGQLPGISLNSHGDEQAMEIARTLRHATLSAIYSSPLERAIQTASPLASMVQMPINILPELTDTNVGKWVGRNWHSLKKLNSWNTIQKTPSKFRFPGGESFQEVQERIIRALTIIDGRYGKKDMVAVFFHADPIKLALAHFLGMPLDRFQQISIHTGSISVLHAEPPSFRVLGLNYIPPCQLPA